MGKCPQKGLSEILGSGKMAAKFKTQIQMQMRVSEKHKAMFYVADSKIEEWYSNCMAWLWQRVLWNVNRRQQLSGRDFMIICTKESENNKNVQKE